MDVLRGVPLAEEVIFCYNTFNVPFTFTRSNGKGG